MCFRARAQPKDGAPARNRFENEKEHHFIEHEHESIAKDVGNGEGVSA
jgi:hypothetical protein